MRGKKFTFGWFEKRRFAAERKRQIKEGTNRYSEEYSKKSETFWKTTTKLPDIDIGPNKSLTEIGRQLVGWK